MVAWWVMANGILAGLGALIALAHPLTVLSSVLAAPLTSLNPMIAAGWVSGLVEALSVLSGVQGIAFRYFDEKDVVRHRLVQSIIVAYEAWSGDKPDEQ